MGERQTYVNRQDIMDPDGGGNGSVVTGIGAPKSLVSEDVASSITMVPSLVPKGEAIVDSGQIGAIDMVGEGGNSHGQY